MDEATPPGDGAAKRADGDRRSERRLMQLELAYRQLQEETEEHAVEHAPRSKTRWRAEA
ncbi:MAG: hypothetical protein QM775_17080 [Pirellulales bacterium]